MNADTRKTSSPGNPELEPCSCARERLLSGYGHGALEDRARTVPSLNSDAVSTHADRQRCINGAGGGIRSPGAINIDLRERNLIAGEGAPNHVDCRGCDRAPGQRTAHGDELPVHSDGL